MIFSFKFRTLTAIFILILLFCGVFSLFMVKKRASASNEINKKVIVLDAGHGGRDGGVTGASTGVKESDINLAIVKMLEEFLVKRGYKVVLTRKNSEGLYNILSKNKKMSDMKKRQEIINESKPDLVVSIHQNFFVSPSSRGSQVFYDKNSELGQAVATTIQNTLNSALNGKRKPAKGDYFILECSSYPSVLIECGFLSNPEEEKLLVSAPYQEKIAYTIFSAIHSLLGDNELPYYI